MSNLKVKVFTVYDSKAEVFLPPFYQQTTGLAVRAFSSACNDSGHDFNKYAEDFTLFEIGEFDQEDGVFDQYEAKVGLGLAVQFIEQPLKGITPKGKVVEVNGEQD